MASYAKIRPRRGTKYQWATTNVVLEEGELGVEHPDMGPGSGFCKFKIGDGETPWNDLAYAFDGESAAAIEGGGVEAFNPIQLRSGTMEEWLLIDPVLGKSEIVYVSDDDKRYLVVGDGVSSFSELDPIGSSWDQLTALDFGYEG